MDYKHKDSVSTDISQTSVVVGLDKTGGNILEATLSCVYLFITDKMN